ncbi:MAG: helix-turn-helix domain-containing protein [Candidatus Omnitrophica bacterium]|nr:helix-turn-helix domain-containing protein [Candidatus Omnitrophota bacterium]
MGGTESLEKKLLTTREVSQILGILEKEVIELAQEGKLPHYKVAGEFLRFKKEDVLKVKKEIQKKFKVEQRYPSWKEKVSDFFYFNDFYIISGAIIVILLWLIFKG